MRMWPILALSFTVILSSVERAPASRNNVAGWGNVAGAIPVQVGHP